MVVGLATGRTEILRFSLGGLCDLCGEEIKARPFSHSPMKIKRSVSKLQPAPDPVTKGLSLVS